MYLVPTIGFPQPSDHFIPLCSSDGISAPIFCRGCQGSNCLVNGSVVQLALVSIHEPCKCKNAPPMLTSIHTINNKIHFDRGRAQEPI